MVRRNRRPGADELGACHWIKCQARSGPRSSSHLLLRRSPFPHREAARCPARLGRSGVATCLNDERSFFESPSRTESHCRWRPTPSPFSRLLSHDLTHVRPPLRLPFTLILNAMACAGASRHLGRPHTLSQTLNHQSTQSRSLNHQRDHGARTRSPAKSGGRRSYKFGTCHRVKCQTRSLLRRSLLIHRGPMLAWKRRRRWVRRERGEKGRQAIVKEAPRRNKPARRTVAPWTAGEGCSREAPC